MKKFAFLIAILAATTRVSLADSGCYWVFFCNKSGAQFNPYEYFDPKAIERREKQGLPLCDSTDFPLNGDYVNAVALLADEVVGESRWFNGLGVMAGSDAIEQIKALPFVKEVVTIAGEMVVASYSAESDSENDVSELSQAANVELMPQLKRMQGQKFADNNIDGRGIRIAVFDGGFPKVDKHECFRHLFANNQIVKTWNFPGKKENVYGWNSHGTMTLSCITGLTNIGEGSQQLGLATGAEFLLARTETNFEPFKEEIWWAQAVEWADRNGADIISSSLGYGKTRYYTKDMDGTSFVAKAANLAARKGILVCNSMGNEADDEGWRVLITPADADSVLSVGGIEDDMDNYNHIKFSSFGPTADGRRKPNVVSFGRACVANPRGGTTYAYGTSFSCPLVAGFAACAWQSHRNLTAMELKAEIEKSGDVYPYFDYAIGYGVPQAGYFTDSVRVTVEPTFTFEKNGDALIIHLKPFEKETDVFYNLTDETGKVLHYALGNAKNSATITIQQLPNATVNVYYHGYTGSYTCNEGGQHKNESSITTKGIAQTLRRSLGNSNLEYGKSWNWNLFFQLSSGLAGFKTIEDSTNDNKKSLAAMLGLHFQLAKRYRIGAGVGIGSDKYIGTNLDGVVRNNVKQERFNTTNLNVELFQRVTFIHGEHFGYGLTWDCGVFGSWCYTNRHIVIADAKDANYKSIKYITKNHDCFNRWQWGVKTSINYNFLSVYAKMRFTDLLNSSYNGAYSDFLRFETGLQMTFTFLEKAIYRK